MTTRRLAAITGGLCLMLAIGALVLLALGAGEDTGADSSTLTGAGGLGFVAASLAFATVGAVVATRVPENPIGWIFCVIGLLLAVAVSGAQYADQMLFIASNPLPGGRTAAWLQEVAVAPTFGVLGLALLLFPNGRLPSRRWRPVTLGAFAARLRDEVDLDHLSAELVSAAHHTLRPAHASLWLRRDVPR